MEYARWWFLTGQETKQYLCQTDIKPNMHALAKGCKLVMTSTLRWLRVSPHVFVIYDPVFARLGVKQCHKMSHSMHTHTYRMIYPLDQNGFICCVFWAESKPLIVVAIYLSPRTPEVACPEPHTPVPICQSDRSKCQHYARQGSLSQYPIQGVCLEKNLQL